MDCLHKIFNFIFLSYWLQRDWDRSESYGSGTDHCGTGTGMVMTAAETGRDREQCTTPVQISKLQQTRTALEEQRITGLPFSQRQTTHMCI